MEFIENDFENDQPDSQPGQGDQRYSVEALLARSVPPRQAAHPVRPAQHRRFPPPPGQEAQWAADSGRLNQAAYNARQQRWVEYNHQHGNRWFVDPDEVSQTPFPAEYGSRNPHSADYYNLKNAVGSHGKRLQQLLREHGHELQPETRSAFNRELNAIARQAQSGPPIPGYMRNRDPSPNGHRPIGW